MHVMILVKHAICSGPPARQLMDAINIIAEEAVKDGSMLGNGGLAPTAQSTRVRISKGQLTVTDGPFTEAKEVIGGYWMIDVKSKDEAIAWASRCPASSNEVIEIRQVHEMSDFPPDVQEAAAGFTELQGKSGR